MEVANDGRRVTYEQVGDQTMLQDGREGKNVLAGSCVLSSDQEQSSERDEDVTSPGTSPLGAWRYIEG